MHVLTPGAYRSSRIRFCSSRSHHFSPIYWCRSSKLYYSSYQYTSDLIDCAENSRLPISLRISLIPNCRASDCSVLSYCKVPTVRTLIFSAMIINANGRTLISIGEKYFLNFLTLNFVSKMKSKINFKDKIWLKLYEN